MEALNKIQFHDIINLADIQHFQDLFSDATGVASIITHPDGTPITNPSNFSRLCNSIIRKTEKGCANCYKSDSVIGRYNPSGPVIQSCLSGGLWDAGASIAVGGKHIANWLIGQVRNIEIDDQHMMKYADEIGADKTVFMEALNEVPVMSVSKFKKVSEMMFAFVNEISEKAYNNWQLKTQISERTQTELLLKEKNKQIEKQKEELVEINIELAFQNKEKGKRAAELTIANKELLFQNKEKEKRAAELVIANNELAFQNEEKGKRAAELIIAKEQAEESDNLKTSFLNNISHEIRTPFNGILGFLDIMQDNDLTVKERAEFTTIVNKSAFRLMNTIDNIIEISQIQAGQIEPCLQKTNLQRLTSEIYSHFKTEAEIKGLELLITKQLRVNVENIYTDSSKLKTILTILIGNAIKFTKTGSIELGVKMKMDDIAIADFGEGNPSGSTLQFSVKDSGVSIPEDKQESIFKKFIQADGSNTRDFEGSGLGLAIAKAYVKMLGGKIWVESKEGNGSEFFFTIPYNTKPQDIIDPIAVKLTDQNENLVLPHKILIAEDNEISGKLIEIAVKIFDAEIFKAKTGIEVIEICHKNPDIDFILMDIKMPDIDGYEATRQIRKFNTEVIIIAQTSYALAGQKEKAIKAGCNDYISKPFNPEMLTSLMKKYLKTSKRTTLNEPPLCKSKT